MRTHHSVLDTTSDSNPQEWLDSSEGEHDAVDVLPLLQPLTSATFTLFCTRGCIFSSSGCRVTQSTYSNPPVWDAVQWAEPSMCFCCAPIWQFTGQWLSIWPEISWEDQFFVFSNPCPGPKPAEFPFSPPDCKITAREFRENYEEWRNRWE